MGAGTQNRLAYAPESAWGTTTGTAYTVVRKLAGSSCTIERSQLQTAEFNSRRAVTGMRLGTKRARVALPFELFYAGGGAANQKQFEDFLASWMFSTWVAAGSAASAQTLTIGTLAATTDFTFGTSIATVVAGDWVKITGCSTAANNGYYKVISVSSLVLTLATPNFANMTTGSMGAAVVLQRMGYIIPGTTAKSWTFEESQLDSATYKKVTGAIANTLNLSLTPDAIITGDFGFFGKDMSVANTVYSVTNPAAQTNSVMTANDTLTYLMADNAGVAVATSLSLSCTNNAEDLFPIGSITPYSINAGDSQVSGTMDLYLTDYNYWNKYLNETALSLSIKLMDPDLTSTNPLVQVGYAIDLPNIKITNLTENKTKTNVVQSVPFMALENTTAATGKPITVSMRVSILA